ncbi:sensor histidine kinase [Rhizobium sp. CRIBSB]|nr:sensor histidine kinase [Rhizobium sp. CRIBSB]
MAVALLPVILLGAVQTQRAFQIQAAERSRDLQLAADRTAVGAQSRIATALVLLRAIRPETQGAGCRERLAALLSDLDDYRALGRLDAAGRLICVAETANADRYPVTTVSGEAWFERLRNGASSVVMSAPDRPGRVPGLIVAIRAERPGGVFDGAVAARLPLTALQPDVNDPALPPGAQAALTDSGGRVLISTEDQAFAGQDGNPGIRVVGTGSNSTVFETTGMDGTRRVNAGAALTGHDVHVVLSAPAPGLLSWTLLNPIGTFLLPLAAWLMAFTAVMLLSERIVIRWLDYLERIAAIYARGRFSVRPVHAVHAPAEIQGLARALDALAETISTRDRALLDSLAEKDALMREIHHRVKNNLQIISSLLSLQQRALTDAPAKVALAETRQRITALALIYRTLYQSENIRRADARDFLSELVGALVAQEAMKGGVVASSVKADSLVIDPDKLAPLALWLVEAISNAQKHAFAGRGGTLSVRFMVNGDVSVLEVEDDGPGVDSSVRSGVGRTLMGAFAKQLRGTVELTAAEGGGTIARMTFATPEAVQPNDPSDLGTHGAPSR